MNQSSRKALTHKRIVATAARAIRRAGFRGVGVADIMKEVGLTHGGFYAHFASRNALLVEALDHAGEEGAAKLNSSALDRRAQGVSPLRALVEGYLSERHLSAPESGCPVAALGSEMPRQAPDVRDAGVQRVRGLTALVKERLPRDAQAHVAIAISSQLVGALQMARTFVDSSEAEAWLAANRASLLNQYEDQPSN